MTTKLTTDEFIPKSLGTLVAESREKQVETHSVVSLFSGCGGMDLGFLGGFSFGGQYYDRLPFEVIWANDSNAAACKTYKHNLSHPILCEDINDVVDKMPSSADIVIGGFPCQDVSINGTRKGVNGSRTILYLKMIEAIRILRPRIFVAENVKGLKQAHGRELFERILKDFQIPGYKVNHKLYLAADYGVPQMRERIFIVGTNAGGEFRHPEGFTPAVSCLEALGDLEEEPENREINHIWSRAARSPDQGNRKLSADKPSTTIRAEHHGNIQWHYKLPRRISLREAARLQSFPDDFKFMSGMRETERQIGNAVPPVLAWHIANAVREHIES